MNAMREPIHKQDHQCCTKRLNLWSFLMVGLLPVTMVSAQSHVELLYSLHGNTTGDNLGESFSVIEDLDGDQVPDLLVGATQEGNSGAGAVRIFSGASGAELWNYTDGVTSSQHHLGRAVVAVGDVNGDGVEDFAAGAPQAAGNCGLVRVVSGVDRSLLYSVNCRGGSPDDRFGSSLARLADIDADGVPDFLIGSTSEDPGTGHYAGTVRAISGVDGAEIYLIKGAGAFDYMGRCHSGGDLNHDGVSDWVVGATESYNGSGPGYARLHSGLDGSILLSWTGDAANDRFGESAAFLADLNQDGLPEISVSAPRADKFGTDRGLVRIYSGADGSLVCELSPPAFVGVDLGAASDFGAIAALDDLNGDGMPEFAVGAMSANEGTGVVGAVLLCSGIDGAVLEVIWGEHADGKFGISLSALGDLDGDGIQELGVGDPYADFGASDSGSFYVYKMKSSRTISSISATRARYDRATAVTIHGNGFTPGAAASVHFGPWQASNVVVVDDATITCDTPLTDPGQLDLDVSLIDTSGTLTLVSAFSFTPNLRATGNWVPGGDLTLTYSLNPGDHIYSIYGLSPIQSICTPPFDGQLRLIPFYRLFLVTGNPLDTFEAHMNIPDDPFLAGTEVLFQGLVGASFVSPIVGAWTNHTALNIE